MELPLGIGDVSPDAHESSVVNPDHHDPIVQKIRDVLTRPRLIDDQSRSRAEIIDDELVADLRFGLDFDDMSPVEHVQIAVDGQVARHVRLAQSDGSAGRESRDARVRSGNSGVRNGPAGKLRRVQGRQARAVARQRRHGYSSRQPAIGHRPRGQGRGVQALETRAVAEVGLVEDDGGKVAVVDLADDVGRAKGRVQRPRHRHRPRHRDRLKRYDRWQKTGGNRARQLHVGRLEIVEHRDRVEHGVQIGRGRREYRRPAKGDAVECH